jgi:hypothetical protein
MAALERFAQWLHVNSQASAIRTEHVLQVAVGG